VKRINNALLRRDQIQSVSGEGEIDYLAPIVADAEAGFGGNLNAFELMKGMIEAGAAGVHFEDQLSSAKKCGHLGGKVLVSTQEAINKLVAARLAADVQGAPTVIIARTDADAAGLLTSDIDERDQAFCTGERTAEGFFVVKPGLEQCISRGLSYAPYSDLIWMETSHPDLGQAREFAQAIHQKFPGKMLAYNCSPSFNWAAHLSETEMESFRENLAELGYKFQFITLAGFHALNTSMFELSKAYKARGMAGYSQLQEREFTLVEQGFSAVKHQSFVGTGYFDFVQNTVQQGRASTVAMAGSTEAEQF
jgi:isocitrate lyase